MYALVKSLFMSSVIHEFCGWSDVTIGVTSLSIRTDKYLCESLSRLFSVPVALQVDDS